MAETIIVAFGALGVFSLLLYALLYHARPWLRKKQGYWHEDEIEKVLLPILDRVIVAIFNLSEHSYETIGEFLDGADKKELARLSYPLVLDLVAKTPLPLPIFMALVSEEDWCGYMQKRYDELVGWYRMAGEGLLKALKPGNTIAYSVYR